MMMSIVTCTFRCISILMLMQSVYGSTLNVTVEELSNVKDYKTIREVSIHSRGFSRLTERYFAGWAALERVYLSNNGLYSIGDNAFADTKISFLDLSRNKLDCNWGISVPNNTLRMLNLSHNRIEDCPLKEGFDKSTKLMLLDMSYNRIVRLQPKTFARTRIQVLLLNNNKFACLLPNSVLEGIEHTLWKIDLRNNLIGDNYLTEKCPTAPMSSRSLRTVELSGNKISRMTQLIALLSVPNLVSLDLKENDLKCVPWLGHRKLNCSQTQPSNVVPFYPSFRALRVLNLALNKISFINENAFSRLKLEVLYLQGNRIQCLPNLYFISRTLTVLDLSENILNCSKVTPDADYPMLQQISLVNTSLVHLPRFVYNAPRLMRLDGDRGLTGLYKTYMHYNKTSTTNTPESTGTTAKTSTPAPIPYGIIRLKPNTFPKIVRLLPTTTMKSTLSTTSSSKLLVKSTTTKLYSHSNTNASSSEGSFITFFMVFVVILIVTVLVVAVRKRGEVEETEEFYSMYGNNNSTRGELRREGSIGSAGSWESFHGRYSRGSSFREDSYRGHSFRSGYYSPEYSDYSHDSRDSRY